MRKLFESELSKAIKKSDKSDKRKDKDREEGDVEKIDKDVKAREKEKEKEEPNEPRVSAAPPEEVPAEEPEEPEEAPKDDGKDEDEDEDEDDEDKKNESFRNLFYEAKVTIVQDDGYTKLDVSSLGIHELITVQPSGNQPVEDIAKDYVKKLKKLKKKEAIAFIEDEIDSMFLAK